jgi:hypothetical protein
MSETFQEYCKLNRKNALQQGTTEVVPCYKAFQNKLFLQIDELLPAMIQMRLPWIERLNLQPTHSQP